MQLCFHVGRRLNCGKLAFDPLTHGSTRGDQCKVRIFCPSCHAKRLAIGSEWLHHALLYAVPHRLHVFTVPKRLRPFFLYDRCLRRILSPVACRTLRDFMRATLREPDVVPGAVASIQSPGSLLNWHPHLHCLVTDGAFRSDGTFLHLGYHEIAVLTEAFRRSVLRELVRLDLLTEDDGRSMLRWPHGGFHVDHSVQIEADDLGAIFQLARYLARSPVSLERLQYDACKQQVTLCSDKREGPTAGTHVFPALEVLALLFTHVPDAHERLIRAYGAYSVRRRARWRRNGILADTRPLAACTREADASLPDWSALWCDHEHRLVHPRR